ncbi:SDR family oxidoreductase [Cohnella thailandensis]|uniref:SDR family oxidoreductase n=1 Tax=Cohnella thailandensis TaxID=557557 RepID=A0A841SX51_9BACL|nr:SDR family oxidoreductase [Cohnella thailandensis]MBB6634748.1 SDR family oxidoreductase [Cohnella thailandensis]MBP1977851.1 nucleoside-diphosphate-sugar epimerase [Cohnella thailandensis]
MRVFVTGATGFIGSAVVRELIDAGHEVVGLARSDNGASALKEAGADVHRGSLEDLDSLRGGASAADGVIHLAFNHDFSNFAASAETDSLAIDAIGSALEGTGKPLVVTSGTLMLKPGTLVTEKDASSQATPRRSEEAAFALVERGVRASVVRLAPSVHGLGDHGFVWSLIGKARDNGVSAYIGDGLNRWPAVHRLDAARLFRLALEKGSAGARYHGVCDEGVPFRDIAAVIGRHLNLPAVSIAPEEAEAHFGWLAFAASADNPASSALTRERLGWRPTHPGLISDLEEGHYFKI